MKNFNSMMEDLYASEYKIKKWIDPVTGETKERKVRPKRIDFEASQLRGQPAQKETEGLNMKESFKGTPSVRTNHYSWGTMKTIHSGSDFNIPLHPEHHEAIAKLQDEQEHHFKTEDGKSWTARRKGSDVHFQGANGGNSAVVSHASMKEATEEDLRNELHEVLSADATAGDWIHDFVHSTNPKFAGKSKKERIKMALGAYYGKKIKEEVESIDELNKSTLRSYRSKAAIDRRDTRDDVKATRMSAREDDAYRQNTNGTRDAVNKDIAQMTNRVHKRSAGISSASSRIRKEETELTEDSHLSMAKNARSEEEYHNHMLNHHLEMMQAHEALGDSYTADDHADKAKNHADKLTSIGNKIKFNEDKNSYQRTADQRQAGSETYALHREKIKDHWHAKFPDANDKEKDLINRGLGHIVHNQRNPNVPQMKSMPPRKPVNNMSEGKDPHEYADGEMSIHELKQIKAHVEWILEMLKPETDMPEWVQAKITLAADYLSTACDYLHVELNEELKGGQKKLDKNHNGKLDGQDFAILRNMKKRNQVKEALTAKTAPPKAQATGVNSAVKSTETKSTTTSEPPFDKPYTTNTGTVTDKSGAKHTPMSRARDLARTALRKMQEEKKTYPGLEKEPKKGLPTAMVKTSKNAVKGDTVEGWDDPKKAVKEDVQKVDVPAYLRKAKGEKPLELKDLKRKDTLSDAENLKAARGVKEGISFAEFAMMLEARTQYVVKLSHPDSGHTMLKNYTADKGEDDYDIKRRAQVEHGGKGYSVDSVRKKDIDAYDSEDDENAEKSSTTKRGRGRPAGAKSGARGPRIK